MIMYSYIKYSYINRAWEYENVKRAGRFHLSINTRGNKLPLTIMRWTSVIWSWRVKEDRQGYYENSENGISGDDRKFHGCVDGSQKRMGLKLCLKIQATGSY